MPFTDQRLFRARGLEPVLGIGEIALILDQNGPIRKYASPFYQVLGVEPIQGLGPHGATLLWTQGTAPAGYTLPSGAPTGTIAAGASVQFTNPTILQNGPRQLTQLRWLIRPLALTGAVTVQDIDVQVFLPGAVGRFGLLNQSPGFINMIDQVPEAADAAVEPAQNANMTQQTSPPAISARDNANLSEFFIFEINGPTFKIINNGGASITAGSIAARFFGFRYDLAPLTPGQGVQWTNQLVMGQSMNAPNVKFTAIPTGPFVSTGSYGS